MRSVVLKTDILIIGGGTAGCYAALHAALNPDVKILLVEKANIERSGCLAAGVNAINAYIGKGHTPEDYVEYARNDAEGIVREDLLLSMSQRLNRVVRNLEGLGLVILKDAGGGYEARGWRNIKINGENIKPLLAGGVRKEASITVLNHVNIVSLLVEDGRVTGATGFGVAEPVRYVLKASVVLCATGGASGLYRPNSPGFSRHAMWYPPFNTGAGYAMGILAGAEMTSLEMRFVALRCKDTIAPTGTLAQGAGAKQVNSLGEVYEHKYGLSTPQRVFGTVQENASGRGPCRLCAPRLEKGQIEEIYKAYLNMAPGQTLKWIEESAFRKNTCGGKRNLGENMQLDVEIEGTEPYLLGGHTAAGYWVDWRRQTTLPGLFAAGDVAGGSPQKYVSGAMAEAEIAVESAIEFARENPLPPGENIPAQAEKLYEEAKIFLGAGQPLFTSGQVEEAMQKIMDEYAGGLGSGYNFNLARLNRADARLEELEALAGGLAAGDMRELLKIHELRERLVVCRSLVAHLAARKETRWPGFGVFMDYPGKSGEWECYVNSRLESGRIKIIRRELVDKGERYEHSHR